MNINFKLRQQPDSMYINEIGLYSLLSISKFNQSTKFLKWIIIIILPLIKQSNNYSIDLLSIE